MAILTPEEMLARGLQLLGVTREVWEKRKAETNVSDFSSVFGSDPKVIADLWTRLQSPDTCCDARINPQKHPVKGFLIAMHWLKIYPTDQQRKLTIKVGKKSGRKWSWFFAQKIAALKADVIVWPNEWKTIFTITVDGVHFIIKEPTSKKYKFIKGYFSHKHGSSGLSYEVGISIFTQQVVWLAGPFPAGKSDLSIFQREDGLIKKIPDGHYVIADKGYQGEADIVRIRNSLDDEEVARFKSLALARQENFNSRLKRFAILENRFRGKNAIKNHGLAFNAVAVVCQLEINNGCTLFEV